MLNFFKNMTSGTKVQHDATLLEGATVLDVRTPQEYSASHWNGARNVPLQSIYGFVNSNTPKDTKLVIYCASGMRAKQAEQVLRSSGFSNVTNIGTLNAINAIH
jgi:phage shock protein E